MATPQEVMQAMQTMQGQMIQMQAALDLERQRNDGLAQMAKAVETLAQGQKSTARLVDTRGIGRPGTFGQGDEKQSEKTFPVWQRKLQNYVV